MNLDQYMIPAEEGLRSWVSKFFNRKSGNKAIQPVGSTTIPDPRMKEFEVLNAQNKLILTTFSKTVVDAERRLRKAEFKKVNDLLAKLNKKHGSKWSELLCYSGNEAHDFINMIHPSDYLVYDSDAMQTTAGFDALEWAKDAYPEEYEEWSKTSRYSDLDLQMIKRLNHEFDLCDLTWNDLTYMVKSINLQTITIGECEGDKYNLVGEVYFHTSNKFRKALFEAGFKDPDAFWDNAN